MCYQRVQWWNICMWEPFAHIIQPTKCFWFWHLQFTARLKCLQWHSCSKELLTKRCFLSTWYSHITHITKPFSIHATRACLKLFSFLSAKSVRWIYFKPSSRFSIGFPIFFFVQCHDCASKPPLPFWCVLTGNSTIWLPLPVDLATAFVSFRIQLCPWHSVRKQCNEKQSDETNPAKFVGNPWGWHWIWHPCWWGNSGLSWL